MAPGKRPLTNMCPVIVRDGRNPVLAAGSSGGRRIMASVAQILAFTSVFEMEPATAAHHPRIDVSDPGLVNADARLPADVLEALRADGPVSVVEHGVLPVNFACPNFIVQHGGQRTGISDAMSPWSAAVAQA
jgi:gamma-glutamyltranspeptidase/glutathione hydrolase